MLFLPHCMQFVHTLNSSTSSCTTMSSLSLCTLMDLGSEAQSEKKSEVRGGTHSTDYGAQQQVRNRGKGEACIGAERAQGTSVQIGQACAENITLGSPADIVIQELAGLGPGRRTDLRPIFTPSCRKPRPAVSGAWNNPDLISGAWNKNPYM